jgi:hypothetical protein
MVASPKRILVLARSATHFVAFLADSDRRGLGECLPWSSVHASAGCNARVWDVV